MRTTVMCLLVAAAGSGCVGGSGSSTSEPPIQCGGSTATATATVQRPATPATEFRIKRCQLDAGACLDLCNFVEASNSNFGGQIVACTASFEGDSQVKLTINYENGCAENGGQPVFGTGGGGTGGGGVISVDAGTGV
jgi:hypothetical protein